MSDDRFYDKPAAAQTQWLKPQFDNMPPELREIPRWVCWSLQTGRKVPKAPWLGDGRNASSTDPETWTSFDVARAAYEKGGFSGVGFVLNGDGIAGVDLDHCVINGVPNPDALALLDRMGAGYVEVSPSGTGMRAIGVASPIEKGAKGLFEGVTTELYSNERYLTFTGKTIRAGALSELKNFGAIAAAITPAKEKTSASAGDMSTAEKQDALIDNLMTARAYHDSLRDLAASFVGQGLPPATVEVLLFALMDKAEQRAEWPARRAQIPALVASAYAKFKTDKLDFVDVLAQAKAQETSRYKLLHSADIAQLPPIEWCVKGILPTKGVGMGVGPSGSGKSFLFFDMGAAIASGMHWFGYRVTTLPVVYLVLEGAPGIRQRVEAWERHNERTLPENMAVITQHFNLTVKQDIADLAAVVPPGAVVFIDTLNASAQTIDENTSAGMGAIIEGAKLLQSATGGMVLIVHHTGKNEDAGGRGHSSQLGAGDANIQTTRNGDVRSWTAKKVKDGPDGFTKGYTLKTVTLRLDKDGDPETSCVIVPTDQQPAPVRKPLTPSLNLALSAFRAVDLGVGVGIDEWRNELYRLMPEHDGAARRKAWNRALPVLLDLGEIERDGDRFCEPAF